MLIGMDFFVCYNRSVFNYERDDAFLLSRF